MGFIEGDPVLHPISKLSEANSGIVTEIFPI